MSRAASDVIVGRLPALACLQAQKRDVYRAFLYRGAGGMEEIISLLPPGRITWTDKKELDKLSGGVNHQGVVLTAGALPILTTSDWLDRHREKACVLLVLDGITDPMNFGAIIRSAAAFEAAGVLFQKDRAAPVTPSVVKAAAGGVEYIDLVRATNLVRDIQLLKKEGFWITVLDAGGSKIIWEADLKGRMAIIVGSEGDGVRRLVKEQGDFSVAIPVRGELASLNASVSAALALGEWARQNGGHGV